MVEDADGNAKIGLDHRAGHFRPLRIIAQVTEPIVLLTVRCFCVVQKQKGVAGAMIEARKSTLWSSMLLRRFSSSHSKPVILPYTFVYRCQFWLTTGVGLAYRRRDVRKRGAFPYGR